MGYELKEKRPCPQSPDQSTPPHGTPFSTFSLPPSAALGAQHPHTPLLGLRFGQGLHFYSCCVGWGWENTPGQTMKLEFKASAASMFPSPPSPLSSMGRYQQTLAFHVLIHPAFVGHLLWVWENPSHPREEGRSTCPILNLNAETRGPQE